MKHSKHSSKKALLKKIITGKKIGKSPTGASPFKMGYGLGKTPSSGSSITGAGGSNLGINKIF